MSADNDLTKLAMTGLQDALVEAAAAIGKEATRLTVADVVSRLASAGVEAVVSSLAGTVVGAMLKGLLSSNEKIERKLDKLIDSSYQTGHEQMQRAFNLPATNESERVFRQNMLDRAVGNLEQASVLQGDTFERTIIQLMIGCCEFLSEGGSTSARIRFKACATGFDSRASKLRAQANSLRQQAAMPPTQHFRAHRVLSDPENFMREREEIRVEHKARCIAEATELDGDARALTDLVTLLRAL